MMLPILIWTLVDCLSVNMPTLYLLNHSPIPGLLIGVNVENDSSIGLESLLGSFIPNNTSNAFLIGYVGANWPNIRYGLIRMYGRVLTSAEITQNYQATKTRFGL